MIVTATLFLGLFAAGIALGALESPERFLSGKRTMSRLAALILVSIGHAVVIDQDLVRRLGNHKGGGYLLCSLFAPPLAAVVYLIRSYGSRSLVLVPLYLGVVAASAFTGFGLGWLLLKA